LCQVLQYFTVELNIGKLDEPMRELTVGDTMFSHRGIDIGDPFLAHGSFLDSPVAVGVLGSAMGLSQGETEAIARATSETLSQAEDFLAGPICHIKIITKQSPNVATFIQRRETLCSNFWLANLVLCTFDRKVW